MHIYIYIYSSKYLVTQLQDIINKLASPQHPHMSRMSVHAPSEGKPDALIIPDAPKPLDEEDYPDVQYWHNRDWINHTKRRKDCGETVPRLGFVTERVGNLVSESLMKIFTSTA